MNTDEESSPPIPDSDSATDPHRWTQTGNEVRRQKPEVRTGKRTTAEGSFGAWALRFLLFVSER